MLRIALVNTNRITPPIAPIGIEYIAETLTHAGYETEILDLCWENDWQGAMDRFFCKGDFAIAGFTIRNTDDCVFSTRHSFLGEIFEMIDQAKGATDALMLLGGVGFSTMPEMILDACSADAGIFGGGENAMLEVLRCMESREEWEGSPGIVRRYGEGWVRNPPQDIPTVDLPPMQRNRMHLLL
jgi:radical SAM superfamily enzyme YgiQ (UPF0313 family)